MNYTVSDIAPIYLLPLLAFVINAFFGRKLYRKGDLVSVAGIFGSFLYSARIFYDFVFNKYSPDYYIHKTFTWFDLSFGEYKFAVDLGIYIDNMTAIMLLMVSGVATLIHIFSMYYMHGEKKYGTFFTYLSLFSSSMLGLVLSDNLLSFFLFWELMGFCSYSLIGFYTEKEAAGNASLKAFMTTRVGDVLFLLGILAIWVTVGNVNFVDLYKAIDLGAFSGKTVLGFTFAGFTAFCLFFGTIGKSAQFPLQVWLPDAMMGPTPCSALIHAATMVAAGVYLSLRMSPLLEYAQYMEVVASIGAITAFGAASIALVQRDIKAVLAFSTISQLGYMVMGIGVGAYNASFMHLITHAVFKACLFLSAGSVIHSLHDPKTHQHVQDMFRMGGLKNKLKITYWAMMLCTLAISGIPFFSGFVSKDRILGDALYWGLAHSSKLAMIVPVLGYITALMTAFYMFRMMFLTFFGAPKDKDVYDHCHEEHFSFNRSVPLLLLSVFTLGLFYCGSLTGQGFVSVFPKSKKEWFQNLVEKPDLKKFHERRSSLLFSNTATESGSFEKAHYGGHHDMPHLQHLAHVYGAVLSLFIAFFGVWLASQYYLRKKFNAQKWVDRLPRFNKALHGKYYFDDLYIGIFIQKGLLRVNRALAWFDMKVFDRFFVDGWSTVNRWFYRLCGTFDRKVVDNFVDFWGFLVEAFNVILRSFQSGKIQFYIMILVIFLSIYIYHFKQMLTL